MPGLHGTPWHKTKRTAESVMAARKSSAQVQLKIRMREVLRSKLEKAAERRDVSLNEEAVDRLERSFVEQDYLTRLEGLLGGRATVGLAMIIARVMHQVGMNAAGIVHLSTGKNDGERLALPPFDHSNWPIVPYAFDQAIKAAVTVLESLRPPGDPSVPKLEWAKWADDLDNATASEIARNSFVTEALRSVADPASATDEELQRWGREVASRLVPAKGAKL